MTRLPRLFFNSAIRNFCTAAEGDIRPLSQRLWMSALPLAHAAYASRFIQGIESGTLSPEQYGQYAVQDALYGALVQRDWQIAEGRASDATVRELARARAASWKRFNREALTQWHIADPAAIVLAPPLRAYAQLELRVAQSAHPVCMAVVMLPCNRLWFWLASRMRDRVTDGNLYRFWIDRNGDSDRGAQKLEAVIDRYGESLDCGEAFRLFRRAMLGEVNSFRVAGGEKPLSLSVAEKMYWDYCST